MSQSEPNPAIPAGQMSEPKPPNYTRKSYYNALLNYRMQVMPIYATGPNGENPVDIVTADAERAWDFVFAAHKMKFVQAQKYNDGQFTVHTFRCAVCDAFFLEHVTLLAEQLATIDIHKYLLEKVQYLHNNHLRWGRGNLGD